LSGWNEGWIGGSGGLGADRRLGLDGFELRLRVRPGYEFKSAIGMLCDRRAAFNPISAIDIPDAELVVNSGVMDVAADHALGRMTLCLRNQSLLVFADVAHRVLDLQLGPLRQRPVAEAQLSAHLIEHAVHQEGEIVNIAAEPCERARLRHNQIKQIAVDDEIALAVLRDMNGV